MLYKILFLTVAIFIMIYTFSYGLWELKQKNKLGAVFVFLLSLDELVMTIYTIFVI